MKQTLYALLLITLLPATHALAADPDAARQAADDILFDMDIENASYKVRHDGHLDIEFGPSLSNEQYRQAIARLKADPAIPSVLAGRGSQDYCPTP